MSDLFGKEVKNSDYVTKVALNQHMRERVEDKLLGLLDFHDMWEFMHQLSLYYMENHARWNGERYVNLRGSPGKITTGLRDLLFMLEMYHGKAEERGSKMVANEIAQEWRETGLWSDNGATLRRHYLRIMRNKKPTMSMARAAYELLRHRKPRN